MPIKGLRNGQKVKVAGKEGIVMNIADNVKVKFEDGDFGFFNQTEVYPVVDDTRLKCSDKMKVKKEEHKVPSQMMTPTAAGQDPLAQPTRRTGRGVGEEQNVLGKSMQDDIFKKSNQEVKMAKEAKKEKLAEAEDEEMKKKKVEKESEAEPDVEKKKDEEESEVEKSDDEDEDDEEEKKKKKKAAEKELEKGEGYSSNPEEENATAATSGHTTTPQSVIGNRQNVFVPSSSVDGKREQSTPMDSARPASKSVEPDLMKSPLFKGISKQLDEMEKAFTSRIDAMEKSFTDRMNNVKAATEKVEKFYKESFYKSAVDNAGPESTVKPESVQKQIEEGKVRFR